MKKKIELIMKAIYKRPIVSVFVLGLFVISQTMIGYAVWMAFLQSEVTATVTSQGFPAEFTIGFADFSIDASNGSVTGNSTAEIYNSNGNVSLQFNVTEGVVDFNDGCTDFENDCVFTYSFEGVEITNEDYLNVEDGFNEITATLTCERFSCPQNRTSLVTLI